MTEPLLEVRSITKRFGGKAAHSEVSFDLQPGRIDGLIGPNGAGKTTLVNVVTGVHRADTGSLRFAGADVSTQRPFESARRGLSRTFQIVQPFPQMTVLENVAAGSWFAGRASSRMEAEAQAMEHLNVVGLADLAGQPASSGWSWRNRSR